MKFKKGDGVRLRLHRRVYKIGYISGLVDQHGRVGVHWTHIGFHDGKRFIVEHAGQTYGESGYYDESVLCYDAVVDALATLVRDD